MGDKEAIGVDVKVSPHKLLTKLCPSVIPTDALQAFGEFLPDTGDMSGMFDVSSVETEGVSVLDALANLMGKMLQYLITMVGAEVSTITE